MVLAVSIFLHLTVVMLLYLATFFYIAPFVYSSPCLLYILCVQNVAFVSFLTFATVQLFFAIFYAKSQSLMTDCAAMYVDVLSYVINFWAERLKHGPTKLSPRQLRLQRLYLELIPPFLSVVTLVAVTVLALQTAIETLIQEAEAEATRNKGLDNNDDKDDDDDEDPDLSIMMAFSGLNLILDLVNVGYFVKADQAIGIGLPHQHGEQLVHVEYENKLSSRHSKNNQQDHLHIHHDDASSQNHFHCHQNEQHQEHATEETPLVFVRQDHFVAMTDKEDNESFESPTECESEGASIGRNLNMCSAWTVRCIYTYVYTHGLVASRSSKTLGCILSLTYAFLLFFVSLFVVSMFVPILCAAWQSWWQPRWVPSFQQHSHRHRWTVLLPFSFPLLS
jgi:Cation efflux family